MMQDPSARNSPGMFQLMAVLCMSSVPFLCHGVIFEAFCLLY